MYKTITAVCQKILGCTGWSDSYRRNDSYGGTLSNRLKIIIKIVEGIKSLTGANFPVIIKMNCQDFIQGGFAITDAIKARPLLSAAGIDAFKVNGGILTGRKKAPSRPGIRFEQDEAYFRMEAALFKEKVKVILVGGIRSYSDAENIVKKKIADYVSMSRPSK